MTNLYFSQQIPTGTSLSCTTLVIASLFFLTYSWYETFRHTWDYGLHEGIGANFTVDHPLVDATFSSIYTLAVVTAFSVLRAQGLVSDELLLT